MTISHLAGLNLARPRRHPRRRSGAAAGSRPRPLRAQDKDPVVAKVNGTEIHQSDLAVAEEEAGQIPPMSPDAKQDYLVQFMADMILVSKAAEAKKLGDTPEFKRKLAFTRNKLLMEAAADRDRQGRRSPTTRCTRSMTTPSSRWARSKEVHARHILIRAAAGDDKASKEAEDKIKAVIVRLKKGEDFAKVAERSRPRIPPARPMAAISAISPRSRWCRNSPTPPSSSTRARFPIR